MKSKLAMRNVEHHRVHDGNLLQPRVCVQPGQESETKWEEQYEQLAPKSLLQHQYQWARHQSSPPSLSKGKGALIVVHYGVTFGIQNALCCNPRNLFAPSEAKIHQPVNKAFVLSSFFAMNIKQIILDTLVVEVTHGVTKFNGVNMPSTTDSLKKTKILESTTNRSKLRIIVSTSASCSNEMPM